MERTMHDRCERATAAMREFRCDHEHSGEAQKQQWQDRGPAIAYAPKQMPRGPSLN